VTVDSGCCSDAPQDHSRGELVGRRHEVAAGLCRRPHLDVRIRTLCCVSPTLARAALLTLAISLAAAPQLRAQRSATGVRDLGFGSVLPGVRTTVHPTDVARSGQFQITGEPNDPVEITFLLPSMLTGPGGATMPVSFTDVSAGFSASGSITNQVFFDPRFRFQTNLSSTGRGTGFLGGVLDPSPTQPAGSYSGSVSITVAFLGQ
jgi:hypothetical protein